jgi:2-dehydropantoate 2-reductase
MSLKFAIEHSMKFIIYGAGGIGGTLGARLHQRGEDVTLIARGAHLQALQAEGLRLIAPDEDVRLQIPAVQQPSELRFRGSEVVILCVKSQHSVQALEDLRAAAGDKVTVVCCQNGVANEREALRRFRDVYGMLVVLPALHLDPGVVVTHASRPGGVLDLGRYPEGIGERGVALAEAVTRAGFSAVADPAIMRKKFAKLLMNLSNALQAATEMAAGANEISRMLRQEALACYEAASIDCATADEMRSRRGHVRGGDIPGVPRGGGSSWQSVVRGTGNVESDYLNGEIVLLGRLHGVPTPANAVVQALAADMARRRLSAGSIRVAEVRRRIDALS